MRGSRTAVIEAPRSPGSTAPTHADPSASIRTQDSSQNNGARSFRPADASPSAGEASHWPVAIWFVLSTRCTAQVISSDVNGLVT